MGRRIMGRTIVTLKTLSLNTLELSLVYIHLTGHLVVRVWVHGYEGRFGLCGYRPDSQTGTAGPFGELVGPWGSTGQPARGPGPGPIGKDQNYVEEGYCPVPGLYPFSWLANVSATAMTALAASMPTLTFLLVSWSGDRPHVGWSTCSGRQGVHMCS